MLHGIADFIEGKIHGDDEHSSVKIKGTVVLMKNNVLDFNDFNASVIDRVDEFLGKGVSFQLISSTIGDPSKENRGKVGKPTFTQEWIRTLTSVSAGDSQFKVTFEWDESKLGVPGAVIVKNNHHSEFYLKSLTLEGVPSVGRLHFVCNSWVYPVEKYNYDRVFFANHTYLPSEMPNPLRPYRHDELLHLRGEGVTGELKEHDRVYDYAYYNDLGDVDRGVDYVRPVLGGSQDYPYPRRGKTGRRPTKKDPHSESRLPVVSSLNIYVPRDERFGHLKMSDFLGYSLKAVVQSLVPILDGVFDTTPLAFDTFQDVLNLYEGGIPLPHCPQLDEIKNMIPFEMIKELVRTDGEHLLRLPLPQVIKDNTFAWRTDEEFGREMLAGVNPVIISLLKEFPPTSNLDLEIYGNQTSSITVDHIEKNLEGLTVDQALTSKRLFILDHHDALMPYLNRINAFNKIYASRTILLLNDDSTLKPLAIELSLPHPDGEGHGAVNKVFTPATDGVKESIWQLAKAYAAVNDSGYHQLISHWLDTHAIIEPLVIATNRQLSVVHPICRLLSPHYRDTMNINALGRQILINAGGFMETTVFPGRYAMEMSSKVYKSWKFTEQGLPADLLKRGVAVTDTDCPNKIRLLIKDYPYAVDGLAIWSAIETWVEEYCSIYYPTDDILQSDVELQAWWKEIREVGHGDKKDEPWWPKMQTVSDLTQSCTNIIWIASALHAAVNFGQYSYAGYIPNRPTISRRFMPEPGSADYVELAKNPEKVFLRSITSQLQTILGVSVIEILSRHSSDEIYLGQRESAEWTSDQKALDAFKRFGDRLIEIENLILEMNKDESLKNRNGPVKVPYTLLYPGTSDTSRVSGLTGRGIPNSVSI